MLNVTDSGLYQIALEQLARYAADFGRSYKGRFVQIFLGLKFHQNNLPSMFSGAFVSTEVLQTMLDDVYAKSSRDLNNCVLSLFENNYLARTGLVGPGNNWAQNTWRNNLNLQKGIGCYAQPNDLASNTFLDQQRTECRYLEFAEAGKLAGSTCSLCGTGAKYRGENHRKWLRIGQGGNGYAVVDLYNTNNFEPYVCPGGARIPALPLIQALYHDALPSLLTGTRTVVDLSCFKDDFNFTNEEFVSYFDDDPLNKYNAAMLSAPSAATYDRVESTTPPPMPQSASTGARQFTMPINIPTSGDEVPPPAFNSGWNAEQYVIDVLRANEWEVHDVSRQQVGFDLLAKKGRATRYFEVKSSLGTCTPCLTAREWQQAHTHADRYVLAIIENFKNDNSNTVYWVKDPANNCTAREHQSASHNIPRSSWTAAATNLAAL